MPFAPAAVLATWALTAAAGVVLTVLWVVLLTMAVTLHIAVQARRYRR